LFIYHLIELPACKIEISLISRGGRRGSEVAVADVIASGYRTLRALPEIAEPTTSLALPSPGAIPSLRAAFSHQTTIDLDFVPLIFAMDRSLDEIIGERPVGSDVVPAVRHMDR